jgi:hypothetical protein
MKSLIIVDVGCDEDDVVGVKVGSGDGIEVEGRVREDSS